MQGITFAQALIEVLAHELQHGTSANRAIAEDKKRNYKDKLAEKNANDIGKKTRQEVAEAEKNKEYNHIIHQKHSDLTIFS